MSIHFFSFFFFFGLVVIAVGEVSLSVGNKLHILHISSDFKKE